ncbi:trichohyalin isoform X6 [Oncorhynchus tshawytscha]|uniref:trichohyalin isoform X6 n=1 Tax=Oncorhynchus tshawytscha TaxID=74940 RepID=UPI000D0A8D7C|nr:trichohyalin isoform X6 [Oncorhynchus tshawytscha]
MLIHMLTHTHTIHNISFPYCNTSAVFPVCVYRGNQLIINQIEERLEDRMLQNEMKEHEGQQMLENLERMQMEELEALVRKKEEQQRLQQEILRINEDKLLAKERKKEDYEHLHNREVYKEGDRLDEEARHRRDQGEEAQGAQGCWTSREVLQ